MSTYNGEKYLKTQIDSILSQEKVDLSLLVRDDGSTDSTVSILKQYKKNNQSKFNWYKGENLKPAKSFMDLVQHCGDADYYAFADQDDYWKKDKIYSAIKKLEKTSKKNGSLYFSSLTVVDENLNELFKTSISEPVSFPVSMVRNQATGCTMVFNNVMRDYVKEHNFDYVCMHDSLFYRIALLKKYNIVIDDKSYILYRQHSNNVVGMTNNFRKKWITKFKKFFEDECETSLTAKELLKLNDINKEDYKTLLMLSNYKYNINSKLI